MVRRSLVRTFLLLGALSVTTNARAGGLLYDDVAGGNVAAVTAALAKGADVNAPLISSREGETRRPLYVAAQQGKLELVRLLLARGADVEHREGEELGRSAFEAAYRYGRTEVFLCLFDAAPSPTQEYLGHLLRTVILERNRMEPEYQLEPKDETGKALARRVVAKGVRPDGREVRWLFHELMRGDDLWAIDLLLEEVRVDPNLPAETFDDHDFGPPIVEAAERGRVETVKRLVDHGARLDARGERGMTALHAAVLHEREDVAQLLLTAGASPAALDAEGHRPAWSARVRHLPRLLEILAAGGGGLTATEEAEVVAREEAEARVRTERAAKREEERHAIERRRTVIRGGAFAAWALYVGASIAAQRAGAGSVFGRAGSDVNLWAGPLLAGLGAGSMAGIGASMAFSSGEGGIPAIVDPRPPGILVGLATMITLGALNYAHRSDLSSHPWLYYAGPALSVGIPLTVRLLEW